MGKRRVAPSWTPRERLECFVARVEELQASTLVRSRFNPSLSLKFGRGKPLEVEHNEPGEDCLRAFLVTFRQFIMKDESIFIMGIFNLADTSITSSELQGEIRKARASWRVTTSESCMKLEVNSANVDPEELLDLWINGCYFHNDAEKARRLRELGQPLGEIARAIFLGTIVHLTSYLLYLGNAFKAALREGLVK